MKSAVKPSVLAAASLCATLWMTLYPGVALSASTPADPLPPTWPREYDDAQQRIQIFQPQIDTWNGPQIAGRAAIAVGDTNGQPSYGVAHFTAQADIDKTTSTVHLANIVIDHVDMPATPSSAASVKRALDAHLPRGGLTMSLEQLQADYAATHQGSPQTTAVQNNVPTILFTQKPTVLVLADGDPVWRAVTSTPFERMLNARALLLKDSGGGLHLNAAGYWYGASSLQGPWHVDNAPSQALSAAAKKSEASLAPDPMLPSDGKRPAHAPDVIVAPQPAELIVTSGQPSLQPVKGLNLLSVTNADHAVFVEPSNGHYYVLLSGRWFSAPNTNGPWSFVDGKQLPPDFAKIPTDDPHANALVSVPGTPQAKEAAIAASIPQTATVSRKTALQVKYDGAPKFTPIQGTSMQYAVNTATPVIETGPSSFYAVANGVWFTASSASGPWHVADAVPQTVYTIPPSSPVYYVTYVHVYSSTPEAVVVGYTPGYLGVVVSPSGTVVYGTGYVYQPYVGTTVYYAQPATYGYGAGFALGTAVGFAFGFAMGSSWGAPSPYWGPYYWGGGGHWSWQYANVNSANFYGRWGGQGVVSHSYGWNGYTGNAWRGSAASGFNPYTGGHFQASRGAVQNAYNGNFAAGRQGSFSNPTTGREGAGRSGVAGNRATGDYAAGRQAAGYNANTGRYAAGERGVTGNAYNGTASAQSRGITGNTKTGNAVAWNNGNVYAGHDGNVYKHDEGGGWEKHTSDGWQPAQADTARSQQLDQARQGRQTGDQRSQAQFQRPQGGGGGFGGGGGGRHFGRR